MYLILARGRKNGYYIILMLSNPFGFAVTVPAGLQRGDWLLSLGGQWVGAHVEGARLVGGAGGHSLLLVLDLVGARGPYQTALPLVKPNGEPYPGARARTVIRRAPGTMASASK